MSEEKKINPHPQRYRWVTTASSSSYVEARTKADACRGSKIKRRPNGTFEVRVGTEVKPAKAEPEPEQS